MYYEMSQYDDLEYDPSSESESVFSNDEDPFEKIHRLVQSIKTLVEDSQKDNGADLNKDQKTHILGICAIVSWQCTYQLKKSLPNETTAFPSAAPTSGTKSTLTVENITRIVRESIKEELKNLPILHQKPTERPLSYAAMASIHSDRNAKPPANNNPVVKSTKPAIIIAHKNESATREETIRTFSKAADFKTLPFAPARVQSLSKQKFRVEFDSEEQKTETLKRLAKDKNLTTEAAKKLRPMLILKGISNEVPNKELKSLILQQNPTVKAAITDEDNDLSYKFVRNNRNRNLYNAVFITTPKVFRAMIDLAKINVDYMRIHVEEFSPFLQCFQCLQFGHTKNKCSHKDATCPHCTEKHDLEHCPTKDDPKKSVCLNCKTHNVRFKGQDNTQHRATSTKCPRVKSMLIRVQQRIDYGIEI